MPRVPEYGQSQVSSAVGGANMPAAPRQVSGPGPTENFASADAFGVAPINPAARGNAIRGVAQGMSTLAAGLDRFAERRDAADAEAALVQFEREKNRRFFDPEAGYFNTQGRDAFERAQPTLEELQKLQRESADALTSPRAREMFGRATDQHLTRAEQDIMRYASDQFRAYERSVISTRVEQTIENALLHWNDPEQRAVQLEVGYQNILDLAVMNGESPEVTAENLQNYNSRFGVATVQAALVNGAIAGQMALAEIKYLLEPQDIIKMQEAVDSRYEMEDKQRISQTAVQMAGSLVQQYGDEPNARKLIIAEVSAVEQRDPALGDALRRESLQRLEQYHRAVDEERQFVYEAVEVNKLQGGTVDQFIAEQPEAWMRLTPKQQATLATAAPVKTDYSVYSELMLMDPDELAKVNPSDYFDSLAPADRQRLTTAVRSAREGDTLKLPTAQSLTAKTTAAAEQLFGQRSTWKNPTRAAQVQAFIALVESEAAYRTQEKGSALTPSEYTTLLNDMTRQSVVERPWYTIGRKLSEADLSDIKVPDSMVREGMTQTDYMLEISDALRQMGVPVTANNIMLIHKNQGR